MILSSAGLKLHGTGESGYKEYIRNTYLTNFGIAISATIVLRQSLDNRNDSSVTKQSKLMLVQILGCCTYGVYVSVCALSAACRGVYKKEDISSGRMNKWGLWKLKSGGVRHLLERVM